VDDHDCQEIIILNGTYEINLVIANRSNLTIRAAEQGKVTLKGPEKDRQTIFITSSNNITIEGLMVERQNGNIGVFIDASTGVKLMKNSIQNYTTETGISITRNSNAQLEENTITNNKVGVSIKGESTVTFTKDIVKDNKDGDGIEVLEEASVTLRDLEISNNKGCGVRATSGTVKDGKGRSNWIFGNQMGNTCPRELSRTIRRPEILVPGQFKELQKAIKDAEPVQGAEDTPYLIHIRQGKDEYAENLCIDRSVKIQIDHKVRIRPTDLQKPTIAVGSKDCRLHKEERGNVDSEAGDTAPSIRIHITGGLTIGPPDNAPKGLVGVQIEQDPAQKTFLKATFEDITVENSQTGIEIRPTDKSHQLTVNIFGTTTLRDTDCLTNRDYPNVDPIPTLASIRKNQVGIRVDNSKQADLRVTLRDVEIKKNGSDGILYEGEGSGKFSIERSRIIENEGHGIVAKSKGTDLKAIDELNASLARIWQNKAGGVKLESVPNTHSKLDAKLINVDIRKNTGFSGGVHIQGNVETLLKASSEIPISQEPEPHNCGIDDNFGPGVRAHGSAVLTIENMFVRGNGYKDEGKTQPVGRPPEPGASKVGPDGIFVSDSVQLTVQNTYVGPNNAGVGIALQASKPNDAARVALKDNYIAGNRKWGISYILRACLAERTMPDKFNGKVEGQNNVLVGNGFWLSRSEEIGGPAVGLGRGQVCPKDLEFLILRVQ
jgi:hypothetical protein